MPRRKRKLVIGTVLVLGLFVLAMYQLMRDRLEKGDVYPAYSTLRADPLGTKAFFAALEETPGVEVSRYTRPLEQIGKLKPGTFFYLGDPSETWAISASEDMYLAMERWMRDGGRIVITLRPERYADSYSRQRREKQARWQEERARKDREDEDRKKTPVDEKPDSETDEKDEDDRFVDLPTRWKIQAARKELPAGDDGEPVADLANAPDWPSLPWQSVVYFDMEDNSDWKVVATREGNLPVVVEREFRKGSLVIVSDTYLLTNEGLWMDRRPEFLSWLIGDHTRVYFDEAHLGSVQQDSVATLARRYGLYGGVYMLVLLALLFVWRNARSLAPAYPEVAAGSSLGEESSLALVNLLKRSVKPAAVIPLCIAEWQRTSPAGVAKHAHEVEAYWQQEKNAAKRPNVVNAYQRIQHLLRKKRKA